MKQSSLSLLIRVELLEAGLVASAEAQALNAFNNKTWASNDAELID